MGNITAFCKAGFTVSILLFCLNIAAQHSARLHVATSFHIASAGGWDYIAVGPGNNRLYVSHGTQVNILDETTGDSTGIIPNTAGVHGIAFVPALGKGFTSNGRSNNTTVFNIQTNEILGQIATGQNPDAIMYEPFSKMVITCNGRSSDLSFIDPVSDKLVATVAVGGKPETAVSDEAGNLYVNIEDKNEIVVINLQTRSVQEHWPLTPAEAPTGLAVDLQTKRLFAGCNKILAVIDLTNGHQVAQLPIGNGCDGVAFDSELKNIYASCGEGVLTVIHEQNADKFVVTGNLPTKKGARTLALSNKSHNVYLPTADFGTAAPGEPRAPIIPGSFQVLVVKPM